MFSTTGIRTYNPPRPVLFLSDKLPQKLLCSKALRHRDSGDKFTYEGAFYYKAKGLTPYYFQRSKLIFDYKFAI